MKNIALGSLLSLVLITLIGCACGGGGSGRAGCDPQLNDDCVCEVPETGESCDPDETFPCACNLEGNNGFVGNNGDQNNGPRNNGRTNNGDPADTASIRLHVTLGSEAGRQFQEVAPWATAVLPGYRNIDTSSPLVFMLCAQDDPVCEEPVVLREVAPHETDGAPMQFTFGPQLHLQNLPAGDYLLMVFMDSNTSRALSHGWDDDFPTAERAWGAAVSETDLMLSAAPSPAVNPAPAPVQVRLGPGETVDLGEGFLGHFHEQDLSPAYRGDAGRVVVASPTGIYVVAGGDRDVLYQPIDANQLVCGLIDGPGDTAWALLDDPEAGGEAIQIDTRDGSQLGGRVRFPGVGLPCRGIHHSHDGIDYLFVLDASGGRGPDQAGGRTVWSARLVPGSTDAIAHGFGEVPLFDEGVDDVVATGSQLYLSITPTRGVPVEDRGQHLVLPVAFDRNGRLDSPAPYVVAGAVGDKAVDPQGNTPVNDESAASWAGLAVAQHHDGRQLLFVGGFSEVTVFELPSLTATTRISGHYFGTNFTGFTLDPAGETLWAIPQSKSAYHFEFERGPGGNRQSFNRLMALPLDLSSGAQPAPSAQYAQGDIDGYEGPTLSGNLTPADDPGVDLGYGHYVRHQVLWAPDTAGATFGSSAFPIGHTAVATGNNLWLRGSGTLGDAGPSGLGKGGDLAVFDLESRRAILHPAADQDFYGTWSGGVYGQPSFGFSLEGEGEAQTTVGLIYEAP